jgi:hypothetical protein
MELYTTRAGSLVGGLALGRELRRGRNTVVSYCTLPRFEASGRDLMADVAGVSCWTSD